MLAIEDGVVSKLISKIALNPQIFFPLAVAVGNTARTENLGKSLAQSTVEVQMQPLFDALAVKKLLLALMDYTVGSFPEKATLRFGSEKSKSKSLGEILKQSEAFVPNYLADAGRCTCDVVSGIISDSTKSSAPKSRRGRVCAFCQSIPKAKLVYVNEAGTREKTRKKSDIFNHNFMIYMKEKSAKGKNPRVSILSSV